MVTSREFLNAARVSSFPLEISIFCFGVAEVPTLRIGGQWRSMSRREPCGIVSLMDVKGQVAAT